MLMRRFLYVMVLPMTDYQIVEALGGAIKVAQALGINTEIVRKFKARGIAWKYRPAVLALARRRKVRVPSDFLETQRAA